MKNYTITLLLLTGVLLAGCSSKDASLENRMVGTSRTDLDASLERRMVGTWRTDLADGVHCTWTLHSDGSFVGSVKSEGLLNSLLVGSADFSGNWSIKDGHLVASVTDTTAKNMMPTGAAFSDEVVEITRDYFVIKSSQTGNLERHTRQ